MSVNVEDTNTSSLKEGVFHLAEAAHGSREANPFLNTRVRISVIEEVLELILVDTTRLGAWKCVKVKLDRCSNNVN